MWRSGYATVIPGPPAASAGTAASPSPGTAARNTGRSAPADLLAISAECFRPRRGYLADVREIYVLLMIPAGPRVRQPEIQTAAGGCVLRAEAGWCIVATRDEHRVRTIRTLF